MVVARASEHAAANDGPTAVEDAESETPGNGSARPLKLRAARHFMRDYEKASPFLKHAVREELRVLRHRAKASTTWASEYRRARGYRANVIEIKLAGGPRAIAHVNGSAVTLLAMGDHEVTDRSRRINIPDAVATRQVLPPEFRRSSRFFPARTNLPRSMTPFANEMRPEWLYFLDDHQANICEEITDSIEDALLDDSPGLQVHVIIGGPGTGKTSVLLELLNRLSDAGGGKESWRVGLRVTEELASYVNAATGWNLRKCRNLGSPDTSADVLLVDDPETSATIRDAMHSARTSGLQALVVAFDPLQLGDSLSDSQFARLVGEHTHVHRLSSCYRQKEAVGRAAMDAAAVIAASSPYYVEAKQQRYADERRTLTELCNGVVFTNPSGLARTIENSKRPDWSAHIAWIRQRPDLWPHWPSTLVVVDPQAGFPRSWRDDLKSLSHRVVSLEQMQAIKGLEFQHALIVLSERRYRDICDGFTGSGRQLYDDYRLLRIPFTRAKDSLAIFVRS